MRITRLEPGDQTVKIDFCAGEELKNSVFKIYYRQIGKRAKPKKVRVPSGESAVRLTGLLNHTDYAAYVSAENENGEETARSGERLFRCGFVPGRVVAYLHPDDYTFASSGRSTCSPSIARAPDGALIVSHDIYWGRCGQNITHIYRSEDNGESWRFLSGITPCFWGSLFTHRGALYILGTSTEYGALLLYRSADCGRTWGPPTEILPTGSSEKGGPHKAPMAVVEHGGRLWTGIEFGSWTTGMHMPGAVSANVDSDLTDAKSWVCTGFLPYDETRPGVVKGFPRGGTIEGNIVTGPDGGLYDVLRYSTVGCEPSYGRAYVTKIDPSRPDKTPEFSKVIDFPGNLSKFFIQRDEKTGAYFALSNRVTTGVLSQRNILSLSRSDDLEHWTLCRDILNYADNCFGEDEKKVGFQYPSFIFDGDDILAVSRTALNNAYNFHNANYITFHRIRNFRV